VVALSPEREKVHVAPLQFKSLGAPMAKVLKLSMAPEKEIEFPEKDAP